MCVCVCVCKLLLCKSATRSPCVTCISVLKSHIVLLNAILLKVFAERLEAGQPKRWWKRCESCVRFCYRSADECIKCWKSRNSRRVSWRYFLEDEAGHQTIWYFIAPSSSLMHFYGEDLQHWSHGPLNSSSCKARASDWKNHSVFLHFSQLTAMHYFRLKQSLTSNRSQSLAHLAMEINGPFS